MDIKKKSVFGLQWSQSRKEKNKGDYIKIEPIIRVLQKEYKKKKITKTVFSELIKNFIIVLPTIKKPYYQELFLFKLLFKNRNTSFGKKYHFNTITSVQNFQKNVPVSNYKSIKEDLEKMLKGEKNILVAGKMDWFATSSGTGGVQKFVPINQENLRNSHFRAGMDSLKLYLKNNPKSRLFEGKTLVIGGSLGENPYTGEKNIGFMSAILQKNSPWIGQQFKAPKLKTSYIENWEEKMLAIIEETKNQNITGLAGQPSWISALLTKLLKVTGKNNILEVWPNLELFFRGGMSIELYKTTFQRLLPGNQVKYYQIYNASEGYFATQDKNDVDDMLLLTQHGSFYEFIPFDSYDPNDPHPETLTIYQVAKDIPYVILITTSSGLWRYVLGDTIVFTQLKPRKIKIIGRLQYYIDVVGECVGLPYIEKTILGLSEKYNTPIKDYTVAPLFEQKGKEYEKCYEWVIESSALLGKEKEISKILDSDLCCANRYYDDERHSTGMLLEPRVHIVSDGTIYQRMESQNRAGGQFKFPRIRNDRTIIDPLLAFIKEIK